MNYDFKANWNDVIVPLLSLPKVKRSIKRGIIKFIESGNGWMNETYDSKRCPASYGRGDGWSMDLEKFENTLTKKFLDTGFLKEDMNKPKNPKNDDLHEYMVFDPNYKIYQEYKNKILEPFITHYEKTSLRAYQMSHACHWWNPTFSLTLAKIIYPNEIWTIRYGESPDKDILNEIIQHTTVVNKDNSRVFDILYFDENDDTKGGKLALHNTSQNTRIG